MDANMYNSRDALVPRPVESEPPRWESVAWSILAGWWASLIWDGAAWLLAATVAPMATAVLMLNRGVVIFNLRRPPEAAYQATVYTVEQVVTPEKRQLPWIVRAVYWFFIGWWFSAFWIFAGWLMMITTTGTPYARQMFNMTPTITTLKRL